MKKKPFVISILSDLETPVSLFAKLSEHEDVAFLLESSEKDSRLARFSFMGTTPVKTFSFKDGQGILTDYQTGVSTHLTIENPLQILREELEAIAADFEPLEPELPFTGGWVGYMGYGATRYFDQIPQQSVDPQQVPEGYYALYDTIVLFDHLYRRILLISYKSQSVVNRLKENLLEKLSRPGVLSPLFCESDDLPDERIFEAVRSAQPKDDFCQRLAQCKRYIQEGQVFQIVLSHRFSLPVIASPLSIYRIIQSINPSPYAYFLKFPGFAYLGSSPETFVRCHQGEVILRALAGTRPRGKTSEVDRAMAAELKSSEKEMAEHRMLVDLGRNDLGRVCQVGSVQVGEIATLTEYSNVMHLATELTGQLSPDRSSFEVFQACFPRGTVTGAPKIRAMRLLSELEPEQRGIYSGVVGYFDFSSNMDAAIAIRSVLVKDGVAHVNAGAGVVYDSDIEAEYEETRNKAKSILKAVQLAEMAQSGQHDRSASQSAFSTDLPREANVQPGERIF